ncbi:hypothetical protein [Streptomyces sp. NPDC052496]|uniref:hypothetical protein n=1 Tax=Streptomyces sp. NPDC052496 TaxID=3154951 RepID=UPI003416CC5F
MITVLAVLMALRGATLSETTAVLASASLLAVTVIHLARGGILRSAVLRGAQRALSPCGQE